MYISVNLFFYIFLREEISSQKERPHIYILFLEIKEELAVFFCYTHKCKYRHVGARRITPFFYTPALFFEKFFLIFALGLEINFFYIIFLKVNKFKYVYTSCKFKKKKKKNEQ